MGDRMRPGGTGSHLIWVLCAVRALAARRAVKTPRIGVIVSLVRAPSAQPQDTRVAGLSPTRAVSRRRHYWRFGLFVAPLRRYSCDETGAHFRPFPGETRDNRCSEPSTLTFRRRIPYKNGTKRCKQPFPSHPPNPPGIP